MTNIKEILENEDFKKKLLEAIEYGDDIGYCYDGDIDSIVYSFNKEYATYQVLELLKETFTENL